MKQIYIVMKSTGEYEDSFDAPFKAFTDKDKADAFVDEKQKYYDDLEEKYRAIDFDVQEKMRELFDRYLQDTHKNLFEAYKKAMDAEQYDESFNWDAFYDMESDFCDNSELVNRYMDICGLSDNERNAILVNKEYRDNYEDGMPFFYVSHHVLELED